MYCAAAGRCARAWCVLVDCGLVRVGSFGGVWQFSSPIVQGGPLLVVNGVISP